MTLVLRRSTGIDLIAEKSLDLTLNAREFKEDAIKARDRLQARARFFDENLALAASVAEPLPPA